MDRLVTETDNTALYTIKRKFIMNMQNHLVHHLIGTRLHCALPKCTLVHYVLSQTHLTQWTDAPVQVIIQSLNQVIWTFGPVHFARLVRNPLIWVIYQDLQIFDGTWSSGQFVRAFGQVTDSHLLKCRYPLGEVHRLVTHPSNIPDW